LLCGLTSSACFLHHLPDSCIICLLFPARACRNRLTFRPRQACCQPSARLTSPPLPVLTPPRCPLPLSRLLQDTRPVILLAAAGGGAAQVDGLARRAPRSCRHARCCGLHYGSDGRRVRAAEWVHRADGPAGLELARSGEEETCKRVCVGGLVCAPKRVTCIVNNETEASAGRQAGRHQHRQAGRQASARLERVAKACFGSALRLYDRPPSPLPFRRHRLPISHALPSPVYPPSLPPSSPPSLRDEGACCRHMCHAVDL